MEETRLRVLTQLSHDFRLLLFFIVEMEETRLRVLTQNQDYPLGFLRYPVEMEETRLRVLTHPSICTSVECISVEMEETRLRVLTQSIELSCFIKNQKGKNRITRFRIWKMADSLY